MFPRNPSRRSTNPKHPSGQSPQTRKACDICTVICFIGNMYTFVIPNITSYSLCLICGETFSSCLAAIRNCSSRNTSVLLDNETRVQEFQREFMEVLERLRLEKRRRTELERLQKIAGDMEQSPELNEQLAERVISSSFATTSSSSRPSNAIIYGELTASDHEGLQG